MLPMMFRQQGQKDPRLDLLTSLDAWYKCDEASGNLLDASGNARHMTDNNTVTTAAGQFGTARLYTATSTESHSIANASWQNWTTNFSLCYWAYPNAIPGTMWHISKSDGVASKFMARSESARIVFYVGGEEGHTLSGFNVGNWHHIGWLYDGSQGTDATRLKLYLNGVQQSLTFTGTIVTSLPASTAAIYVGDRQGSGAFTYDGRMDEIALWSRTISPAEVALHALGTYPG